MPFHKTATFVVCIVLLVAVIILFVKIGPRASPYANLPNEKRPPVELAQDPATQKSLLDALNWDFAFIPVYTAGLILLCFIVGRFANDLDLVPLRYTWWIIAVVIAGVFIDVAENVALIKVSNPSHEEIWESIARFGRVGKYFSPLVGNVYSLVLGIWCVVRALRH